MSTDELSFTLEDTMPSLVREACQASVVSGRVWCRWCRYSKRLAMVKLSWDSKREDWLMCDRHVRHFVRLLTWCTVRGVVVDLDRFDEQEGRDG
jgi:hypothetical protein